jgi:hypothetical protein
MTVVLLEDLPQLLLQTSNTLDVGYSLTWNEAISPLTSLLSAYLALSGYTELILKGKWTWFPFIQWLLASIFLFVVAIDIATKTNLNPKYQDYKMNDWASEHFSSIRWNEAGLF